MVAARMEATAVVVFGSVARGDFNKWSDIDVLVICSDLPESGRDRLALVMEDAPVGVQAVAWTPDEFRARMRRRDPIAVEAEAVGVTVRGRLPA